MTCQEMESRIWEHLENQWPPSEDALVAKHLSGCPHCQSFARRLRQLDAALAHSIAVPALSADFPARMQRRIHAETERFSEAQRAQRKRELEFEFEATVAQLRGTTRWFPRVLEGLGYALLAGLAVRLCFVLAPPLADLLGRYHPNNLDPSLLLSTIVSLAILLFGLGLACRDQCRRLLRADS